VSDKKTFPRYKCHKEVNAVKIDKVIVIDGSGGAYLYFTNYPVVEVDHHYMAKHNPSSGGYYVIYDDGYTSWSPAKAFEDGYTLIEEKPFHLKECGTTYRGCAPDCKFQEYYLEKESN
jgi:hypothetical protein